jgi:hypothetical protein
MKKLTLFLASGLIAAISFGCDSTETASPGSTTDKASDSSAVTPNSAARKTGKTLKKTMEGQKPLGPPKVRGDL